MRRWGTPWRGRARTRCSPAPARSTSTGSPGRWWRRWPRAGIPALLLKGPVLADLLYDEDERAPLRGLRSPGPARLTTRRRSGCWPRWASSATPTRTTRSSRRWARCTPIPGCATQTAQWWISTAPSRACGWARPMSGRPLAEGCGRLKVGGAWVRVPRPGGVRGDRRLHAAHHELAELPHPREDLSRADRAPAARDLGRGRRDRGRAPRDPSLLARPAAAAARAGELADRLGLPSAELVEASLGTGPGGRTALGFARLAERRGLRAKAALIIEELFPSPPSCAGGRRSRDVGGSALALAYVWRVAWLRRAGGPGRSRLVAHEVSIESALITGGGGALASDLRELTRGDLRAQRSCPAPSWT